MKLFIGADHGGFDLKTALIEWLPSQGVAETIDCGAFSTDSVDYPDVAAETAKRLLAEPKALAILICGTGIGISIAANKIAGIRAAVAYNPETGALARQHNDANILCLGARQLTVDEAKAIVLAFFGAQFEGGRHERRVEKIMALESSL